MYLNPQWTERSLAQDIQGLLARIDALGTPNDRPGKHALSFLKQMLRAKREQLDRVRHDYHAHAS